MAASCHSERSAPRNVYRILFSTTAIKADNIGFWNRNPQLGKSIRYVNTHCTRMKTRTSKTSETSERVWRTHTYTQIAFKRHLPSCDHEAFRCYPPMNIKYKHSSKFSTPGLYFMPLSWHNKHISFSLPNSAPKMNLSPLYKIICQHYMCWWIIHEGSWRVSAPYESWRKPSWQTPRFCTRTGSRERKVEDLVKRICFWKWYTAPCIHSEGYLFTQAWGQFKWRCRIISSLLNCHNWFKWNDF